jgi:hypothetical protein
MSPKPKVKNGAPRRSSRLASRPTVIYPIEKLTKTFSVRKPVRTKPRAIIAKVKKSARLETREERYDKLKLWDLDRIHYLIRQYEDGTITKEEWIELQPWAFAHQDPVFPGSIYPLPDIRTWRLTWNEKFGGSWR